jgi:hypothetical protein
MNPLSKLYRLTPRSLVAFIYGVIRTTYRKGTASQHLARFKVESDLF